MFRGVIRRLCSVHVCGCVVAFPPKLAVEHINGGCAYNTHTSTVTFNRYIYMLVYNFGILALVLF